MFVYNFFEFQKKLMGPIVLQIANTRKANYSIVFQSDLDSYTNLNDFKTNYLKKIFYNPQNQKTYS